MNTRVVRLWSEQLLFGGVSRKPAPRPSAPIVRSFFTSTTSSARLRLQGRYFQHNAPSYMRLRCSLPRRFRSIRYKSNRSSSNRIDPTSHLGSPQPALSISQRLKQLSKEYGWAALGVYLGLSLLDFPVCFLAVRLLGTERIGHYEEAVKSAFWSVVRVALPEAGKKSPEEIAANEAEKAAKATAREGYMDAEGVFVQPSNIDACKYPYDGSCGLDNLTLVAIWTQLGLAYLVHKSLIFFRVPLTAAVLPKVVRTLRGWGYNIGKKTPKSAPRQNSS